MNQWQRIMEYIDRHGSISPMEAFTDLGITKLATRVSELIRDGVPIKKFKEHGQNRFGDEVYYMRYYRA